MRTRKTFHKNITMWVLLSFRPYPPLFTRLRLGKGLKITRITWLWEVIFSSS